MVEIVKKRLGKYDSLVESIAIKFLSKKVAKDNGDARFLLGIMSSAFALCNSTLTKEQLNEEGDNNTPVVKLRHVMKTMKESGRVPYAEIISNLPQSQKVVLCIAMTLSQVSDAWNTMTFSQLRRYCAQASQQQVLTDLSQDGLVSIIRNLEDAGLFKIGEADNSFGQFGGDDIYDSPLSLGAQLEDVECALGETLFQNDFYKRLLR